MLRSSLPGPHGIDLTAPGGVESLLAFHRALFGDARMEAQGDPAPPADPPADAPKPGPPSSTATADPAKQDERGFPADTPLAEMSVDQREAYWKHQARKHEATVKARADYDEVKSAAEKWREHERSGMPEAQRAAEDARREARAEAAKEFGARLAGAEMRAAVADRMTPDQADAFVSGANLPAYLTPEGDADVAKIRAWVELVAPKRPAAPVFPDLGQGNRLAPKASGTAAGAEMFETRRGRKPA